GFRGSGRGRVRNCRRDLRGFQGPSRPVRRGAASAPLSPPHRLPDAADPRPTMSVEGSKLPWLQSEGGFLWLSRDLGRREVALCRRIVPLPPCPNSLVQASPIRARLPVGVGTAPPP